MHVALCPHRMLSRWLSRCTLYLRTASCVVRTCGLTTWCHLDRHPSASEQVSVGCTGRHRNVPGHGGVVGCCRVCARPRGGGWGGIHCEILWKGPAPISIRTSKSLTLSQAVVWMLWEPAFAVKCVSGFLAVRTARIPPLACYVFQPLPMHTHCSVLGPCQFPVLLLVNVSGSGVENLPPPPMFWTSCALPYPLVPWFPLS